MKTLDELKIIIEQPVAEGSSETKFVNKYGGHTIPKEKIRILNQSSVLLFEIYGEINMVGKHKIPEKANAILLGQRGLFPGIFERVVYSANYCELKK